MKGSYQRDLFCKGAHGKIIEIAWTIKVRLIQGLKPLTFELYESK